MDCPAAPGGTSDSTATCDRSSDSPAARVAVGRLDGLEALARTHAIEPPSMLFIGEVAELAGRLGWFGHEVLVNDLVGRQSNTQAMTALA